MGQPSAEALLLSALLHNQDVTEAAKYGITPDKLRGYRDEYVWCQTYLNNYADQPSIEAFLSAFPDFPLRSHTDVRWAADQVLDHYFSTQLRRNITESLELLKTGDTAEAYAAVRQQHYQLTSAVPLNLVGDLSFLDSYDEQVESIEAPWATLQGATGGLRRGNYVVLAARLGQGKTAYLLALAAHALVQGKRVLFYSLEMTENEVRARLHAILARWAGYTEFKARALRDRRVNLADYKELIAELAERVPGQLHVHTPSMGAVSPSTVASRAEEYDLIGIDYATLMNTDQGQGVAEDWRTATQVSNRLKQISLASNTTICAAAQINREGDTTGWRPPKVKNLAQADAFGQDADVVVTFKRYGQTTTAFSIEKNRHGPSGQLFFTRFLPDDGIFAEITRDDADELRDAEELR